MVHERLWKSRTYAAGGVNSAQFILVYNVNASTPFSPYLHALQAYWRNYQWMLSFFRQSSEDKVSSFYPFCKSILGLTAKSHKITSNTTTYSKNLYYGYISLNPYQWSFGGKWFKCYLLRHQHVSTSPQFFFTCQPEPCISLLVFGFWLLRTIQAWW